MRTAPLPLNFFARAVFWFLALTAIWLQVSNWTSYPAAGIARLVLENGVNDWVQSASNTPGQLKAKTRFSVLIPDKGMATPVATVDPAHYTYGLPLFLSLLLASRSRRFFRLAAAGYVLLLIPQAFSLVLVILRQILFEIPSGQIDLGIYQWQRDGIVLGYMFGTILLPTLAPVVVWLWFDRAFVETLIAGARGLGIDSTQMTFEAPREVDLMVQSAVQDKGQPEARGGGNQRQPWFANEPYQFWPAPTITWGGSGVMVLKGASVGINATGSRYCAFNHIVNKPHGSNAISRSLF